MPNPSELERAGETADILCLAKQAVPWAEFSAADDGSVIYYDTFDSVDIGDEEPHDAAWNKYISATDALEDVGLWIENFWSDNDSLGGTVVRRPAT